MKYGLLKQRNPAYDAGYWALLSALYKGGKAAQAMAAAIIPKLPGERADRYAARLQSTAYIPYLSQIIDYFVSGLFSQDISVAPPGDASNPTTPGTAPSDNDPYLQFSQNADLKGTTFPMLLRKVFGTALLKRKAIVALDFPTSATAPGSAADEQAAGLARPYADELEVEKLIDWEYSDEIVVDSKVVGHTFSWAIIERQIVRRADPTKSRGLVRYEWKVWTVANGLVSWALFGKDLDPQNLPKDEDDIPQVGAGDTSFAQIPLVEIELPEGLWAGNKLCGIVSEHWSRRSALVMGENQALMAIPVMEVPDVVPGAGGGLPDDTTDAARKNSPVREAVNKGYVTVPTGGKVYFAEPVGAAYEVVDKQLKDLKDEAFRVAHQMAMSADNSSSTMRRSGESKKADKSDLLIVLGELGKYARDLAVRVFACISKARGENIKWQAHGLDKFEIVDRQTVVDEAVQMDLVAIPSKTFKQLYKTQTASKLLENASPAELALISKEIASGVVAEDDLRVAKLDAAQDLVENPIPPAPTVVPGQSPPPPVKGAPPGKSPTNGQPQPGQR